MTYYTVCPVCGYKLLKASDGSNLEIICPTGTYCRRKRPARTRQSRVQNLGNIKHMTAL